MLNDEDKVWVVAMLRESESRIMERVEGRLDAFELRMKDFTTQAIGASEKRLLIAFHQWASPLEIKVRSHGMAIGAFEGEKATNRRKSLLSWNAASRSSKKRPERG